MKYCLPLLYLAPWAFLLAGCAGYRMGPGADPPVKSLFIAPVVNESEAPQAVVPFTLALRQGFIKDGRIEISLTEADADGVLEVVLLDYDRFINSTEAFDTAVGQTFRTILRGKATLRRSNGEIVFQDRRFSVDASVIAGDDLVQAEYQNIPATTRDLADRIRQAVLGNW